MTAKTRAQLLALFSTGQVLDQGDFQDNFDSFINVVDTTAQSINSNLTINGTLAVQGLSSSGAISSLTITNLTTTNTTTTSANITSLDVTTLRNSVVASVNAVGSTQAAAPSISTSFAAVYLVSAGINDGVQIQQSVGRTYTIFNRGTEPLKLYPQSGAQINSLGTNNPIIVSASGCLSATYLTSTQAFSHGRTS